MANTDVYALQHSELNGFLFADVGVEASGMTLSVLSALSRLGMDPWQEAARLAKLPRSAAVDGLARIIAALPSGLWSFADATSIAARLVALLPASGGSSIAAPPRPGRITPVAAWLNTLVPRQDRPLARPERATFPTNRHLAIALVMLMAALTALMLNSSGQHADAPGLSASQPVPPAASPVVVVPKTP